MVKLILILAVVVILSWAALGIGTSRGDGNRDSIVDGLQSSVGQMFTATLRPSDLAAQSSVCRPNGADLTVRRGATCRYRISDGSFRSRAADVRMKTGQGNMRFSLSPSDDPRPVPPSDAADITTRTSAKVTFYKEGGTLILACPSQGNDASCVFVLARSRD
ncbi:hypothetical protein [Pseudaestuariivita rosea]|uniref:hypothetical protein n=1 Tax=Pseudaestuariivita rosea TaxID=2763263 RepID=UPI001ABA74AE|nr:hypothetical protein [Pseudaestuariivita rosea]